MNKLQKIAQIGGALTKSWDSIFLRNLEGSVMGGDIKKKPYSTSDMVYTCVSTTARAIGQVPIILVNVNPDGTETVVTNDPTNERLLRPNRIMDIYSFVEGMISWLLLDGNVWVVPYPDVTNPIAWWLVDKRWMAPIKASNGQLIGWEYTPGSGDSITLDAMDVCHIWLWNPDDPIMGLSPLEAGEVAVVTDFQAAKYNQLFFEQGAAPSGAFSTKQKLDQKRYQRIKAQLDERTSGSKNFHRNLLLDKGLQYTAMAVSHRDMEFQEGRKYDASRIMQVLGMKKSIISVTDDINKATATEDKKNWWQGTNLPLMKLCMSAINFTLFGLSSTKKLKFDTSVIEALREDFAERVKTGVDLLKMGYTPNEINKRLELGFDEATWRNYALLPRSVQPVGEGMPITDIAPQPAQAQAEAGTNETGAPELVEEINITPQQRSLPFKVPKLLELSKTSAKADVKFIQSGVPLWKQVVAVSTPIERSFASKTRKNMLEYRKVVLGWIYSEAKAFVMPIKATLGITDIDSQLDELAVKSTAKLTAEATILYRKSLAAALQTIQAEVGESIDIDILSLPQSVSFVENKAIKIRNINKTIKNQLTRQIKQGMENQETVDKIAGRVKGVFNSASNRAKTIARTEVYGAVNHGRHLTISSSSFPMVMWFTALDEDVRLAHSAMHGEVKTVGEPWIVGGESLRYPGDYRGSPGNVINCRCIETVYAG